MSRHRMRVRLHLWACAAAVTSVLWPVPGRAQTAATRVAPPEHPLVQWRLGPPPAAAASIPAPPAPPAEQQPDTTAVVLPDSRPIAEPDSLAAEEVEVVRCRQVLVSDPERAALLGRMLQQGTPLEEATRKLGIVDHVQSVRDYALEDIDTALRAQLETLPDSAWSSGHRWRGRTVYVQLLRREMRARGSIPKLGEGLDESERQRVAQLQRLQRQDARTQAVDPGVEPASVVEQEPPKYPAAATGAGEVRLRVDVGRLGEVLDVTVEYASDPVFETPAIEAARSSLYRAAKRPPGIAEPGTVTLTYKFAAPDAPGSQQHDPQEQDP
jgi:TonB family protein